MLRGWRGCSALPHTCQICHLRCGLFGLFLAFMLTSGLRQSWQVAALETRFGSWLGVDKRRLVALALAIGRPYNYENK